MEERGGREKRNEGEGEKKMRVKEGEGWRE